MISQGTSLLLDTNVLIDYFDSMRPGFEDAVALVHHAISSDMAILVTPLSLKDFYYVVQRTAKEEHRRKEGVVTEDAACSAEEFAWGCVCSVMEFASVVSVGLVDAALSRSLHGLHRDFEDDLILATALRCEASYLVTNDRRLAAKSPVPALGAADTLLVLGG